MLTSKLSFVFNYQVILRTNIRRVRTRSVQSTDQSRDKQNKPPFPRKQREFSKDTDKERKRNQSVSETTSKWKGALKWNNGYGYELKQLGNSSVNKVQKWKTSVTDKLEKGRLSFSREFRNINDESIRKLKQVRESSWVKPFTWNVWWRSLFKKEQDRTRTKPDEQDGVENKSSRWDMTINLSKFAFKSFVHIWTGAAPMKQRRSDTVHMEIPQFELMFHNSENVFDKAFENHIKPLSSDIRNVTIDVIFNDEITSNENDSHMIERCRSDMNIIYISEQTMLREYPENVENKPMNIFENKTMQEVPVVSFQEDQTPIKSCIIPVNEYETKQKLDALLRGARITISVSTESSGKIRKQKGWFQKVVEVVRERKHRTLDIAYESTQQPQSKSEENFNKDVNSKQALQAKRDQFDSKINKIVKDEVQQQVQRIKARDRRELDIYGEQYRGLKCESVRQVRNDGWWNPQDIGEVLNNIVKRLLDDPEVRSLFTEVMWKMLTDITVHILKGAVISLINSVLYLYLFPSFIDAWNANSWTIDTKITETTAKTTITTNIISDTPNEKVSEKPDINS